VGLEKQPTHPIFAEEIGIMLECAHILLADDDENDVLLMRRAFNKAHITNPIHAVGDGEEAVAYLNGEGGFADRNQFPVPCLMLLDLKMPKKNGFEVLRWIRSHPALKRLPVVVLTSSKEVRDINLAYDLGANSYLVKPPDFQDLIRMMKSLEGYWLLLNQQPEVRPA
jgi:CheY-like chemotaxis protein